MTLPNFVGIGAKRAGTTWLHDLLASHPDVYVPTRRKEVHFFDQYYERGTQWYEKFFPSEAEAARYQAIGEITPRYLYSVPCPERIANMASIARLILILRNPVDTVYSNYGLRVRAGKFSDSFEAFLSQVPEAIEWVHYSQYLKRYSEHFQRDQIQVLVFEESVADAAATKDVLAGFFGIAADRFPDEAGTKKINRSYVPDSPFLRALSTDVARSLYRRDMEWIVGLAQRLGVERLMGGRSPLPPMQQQTREYLEDLFAGEISELESVFQLDLASWKR